MFLHTYNHVITPKTWPRPSHRFLGLPLEDLAFPAHSRCCWSNPGRPLRPVLGGGDALYSPFLCPCFTGSWQDQHPAELRTFSFHLLEPWSATCPGMWGWSRELHACWPSMEAAWFLWPLQYQITRGYADRQYKTSFIKCAFIRIAVSSVPSFPENMLPHLHFVYKERCVSLGVSVLMHFSSGLPCLILFAICLCIWMFFFPHWWNSGT